VERHQKILVLLDYDNFQHRPNTSLLDLVRLVIDQYVDTGALPRNDDRLEIVLRVYGGWFESDTMTKMGQDVSIEIQREFPFSTSNHKRSLGMLFRAEMAFALLERPGEYLFNTFRTKSRPRNLKLAPVSCADPGCIVPRLEQFLKKGKCPTVHCQTSPLQLARTEQKLVDSMICCDLVYANSLFEHLILVSSDDDFIPPLRVLLGQRARVVRCHTMVNRQRVPIQVGQRILTELEV